MDLVNIRFKISPFTKEVNDSANWHIGAPFSAQSFEAGNVFIQENNFKIHETVTGV